jgi:hypothetical protein
MMFPLFHAAVDDGIHMVAHGGHERNTTTTQRA